MLKRLESADRLRVPITHLGDAVADAHGIRFVPGRQERITELILISFIVDAAVLSPRDLLCKWSDQAQIVLVGGKVGLARLDSLRVVVPRVTHVPLALPGVCRSAHHLICLRERFTMVELLLHIDHAKSEAALAHIGFDVDKDVVIGSILLYIGILDSAWDVCVPDVFLEWLGNLRLELAVPV